MLQFSSANFRRKRKWVTDGGVCGVGWGGLVVTLREDRRGETGGRYVEVRLVQQNKSIGLKKIFSRWVEPHGARRACGRPIRRRHQVGSQRSDWPDSRGEKSSNPQ